MANLIKGFFVGLGAVAPGLSGSVLLVIFGLYQKAITAISTCITDFMQLVKAAALGITRRRTKAGETPGQVAKAAWLGIWDNLKFLIPLMVGMVVGVFAFSNLVKFLLERFPMQTRFTFLGLVLGSLPVVFKEVRKEGFRKYHYLLVAGAFAVGVFLFYINPYKIAPIVDPHFLQAVLLGMVVAASYLVPGVDSATILSALGMYLLWNNSLADLNFTVLIPAAIGLVVGVLVVSLTISKLMKVCYTGTFSVIFGFFLSIVPSVLKHEEQGFVYLPGMNTETLVSCLLLVVGLALSLVFGNLEKIKEKSTKN